MNPSFVKEIFRLQIANRQTQEKYQLSNFKFQLSNLKVPKSNQERFEV